MIWHTARHFTGCSAMKMNHAAILLCVLVFGSIRAATLPAADVDLKWTLLDGSSETEVRMLTPANGKLVLTLPRDAIRAKGAKRLDVVPSFARAKTGEKGYWFTP